MPSQRQTMIKEKIKDCIRDKFQSHKRETDNMPFHYCLLGKDRMALFSFEQAGIELRDEIDSYFEKFR